MPFTNFSALGKLAGTAGIRRATSISTTTTIQKRTLYFCGPKPGTHNYPLPQHYLARASASASTSAERGAQTIADEIIVPTPLEHASKPTTSTTITTDQTTHTFPVMKDPATSATVDMTSSVAEDLKKMEKEIKKPITTVWSDGWKDAEEGRGRGAWEEGVGAVRMEGGDWKI